MSFARYPKYKDSGVDWFGSVPSHWDVWKLAHAVPVIGSGTTPRSDTPQYYEDGEIAWINTGDLDDTVIEHVAKRVTEFARREHSALKIYPPGSVVIAMYGATIGKLGYLRDEATVNQACCVFARSSTIQPKYLFYSLLGLRSRIVSLATGGGQPNISQEILRQLRVATPPLREQGLIADLLDRETAKIDALIAEQQRLIELLKEKRQAVISHAVTKGLCARARMKPSGVHWLGEIPAHWKMMRFQRCVRVAEGQVDPERPEYASMPLIAPNHIESGTGRLIELETAAAQAAESGKYLCDQGDVVYSKIRPALRKVCVAPTKCLCSADMYPLKAYNGLGNEFLFWTILSENFSAFAVLESERVAMPKINRESLKDVVIPIPPTDEQFAIHTYLREQTLRLDELQHEIERAVGLLNHRKSAIISAAVTGQIDVRSLNSTLMSESSASCDPAPSLVCV